jgi:Outer membrane protein beta-barrel domain
MARRTLLDSSPHRRCVQILATVSLLLTPVPAGAQDDFRIFAGGLIGVSTLSADARSVATESGAALSLYDPENGLAVSVFGGTDLAQYFSVQANWIWNRNDITLVSSSVRPQDGGFYEQRRHSRQHAIVLDGLIYFRRRDSAVRPYLGTGLSLIHFETSIVGTSARGLAPPTGEVSSTHFGLRSHVGIDFRLSRRTSLRYTFSETISSNPIGSSMTPPGRRGLMNFQNLFGFLQRL